MNAMQGGDRKKRGGGGKTRTKVHLTRGNLRPLEESATSSNGSGKKTTNAGRA